MTFSFCKGLKSKKTGLLYFILMISSNFTGGYRVEGEKPKVNPSMDISQKDRHMSLFIISLRSYHMFRNIFITS